MSHDMMKVMFGFAGTGCLGSAAGVGTRAIYWHFMGVSIVDEHTLMPIGIMVAVGTTLLLAGWQAGRVITRFEVGQKELKQQVENMNRRLNSLYCVREGECREKHLTKP